MPISPLVDQTIAAIGPLDAEAVAAAEARQGVLTKPPGSLGRLESLSVQLAGILGQPIPQIAGKAVIVVAGDHGVASEGVSAYPAEVTPQMVFNFVAGGAAINALARHAGASITVIDAGVAVDLEPQPGLTIAKVGYGAGNIARGPAMSRDDAIRCLEIGINAANEQAAGTNLIAGGDMGIGNTTPSAAITAAITGADVATVTGRGTGVDDAGLAGKIATIRRALEVNQPDGADGLDVLSKVGGLEIGVLAGVMLGAAARNCAVVVDGFISGAAALIAWRLCPNIAQRYIAAHRSVEPGHNVGLQAMGLTPLLDMDMRLGEGTGAALAMPIIEAAAKTLAEMATFAEAGVSDRDDG
ncbi:MAG: nicotinate-nucleotide--dimethylbenzimidazole phosphoribosyltransferase [Chloroflexota bacterium]|nr:nicotinate-nucleotide--dimethylbenzimidazole phosphoribosyltransferase [Chloroflexota bacterium]MDE2958427.1 nicotinate-nucleotide--dimethylbenzimidazole phosphoribosyltransferase [Chloroflexota bacterium]